MKAWNIARKDLQIIWRDKGALAGVFVLPLAFVMVLSVATAGLYNPPADVRTRLPVVDLDNGPAARHLLDTLTKTGGVELVPTTESQALEWMRKRLEGRVLIIPPGLSANLEARVQTTLRLLVHPDWRGERTDAMLRSIDGAARDVAMEAQLLDSFAQVGEMQALNPPEYQVFTPEPVAAQARGQIARAQQDPLVRVTQVRPESLPVRDDPTPLEQNVPGYAVLFVFLTAQLTAESIYRENREGTFRRLLAAPLGKIDLLVGKLIPNFCVAMLQMVVLFGVGALVLPRLGLGEMSLGSDIAALVVLTVVVALCSTSLGILIASLARTEGQVGGLSALLLWGMGAVGGCLFPSFLFGGLLDAIGRAVPHHWAVQGFLDLLARGRSLSDMGTTLAVLGGFTLAFFAIGLWRFDFE
ncbi:MAG: ABC transporter permease [Chloroflexi bacterium]|nr:ABC transporter permease [Chloroflexota bacterium]